MNLEQVRIKLRDVLAELEEAEEIVVTSTTPVTVVEKIATSLGRDMESVLDDDEFKAVLNSLNVLVHNIKLDDRDFQSIIGIEKDELKAVFDKLNY